MKHLNTFLVTALAAGLTVGCAQNQEVVSQAGNTTQSNEPLEVVIKTKILKKETKNGAYAQIPMPISAATRENFDALGRVEYEHDAGVKTDTKGLHSNVQSQISRTAVKMVAPSPLQDAIRYSVEPEDRENYKHFENNPVKLVAEAPVSTFSIDVDTGSYSNVRRILNSGNMPRKDAVRVEEMINYFSYQYEAPSRASTPFAAITEVAPSPWNKNAHLVHVGIKGYADQDRPAANIVFLVDVSGSMSSANKLGLLKSSLKLLSKQLTENDRIAIAVYAGASGTVLESTPGNNTSKLYSALEGLTAGGSTNGAAGIKLAYRLAEEGFIKGGINRVILATDGDFNVGTTNFESLRELVEKQRETGVSLTTLGFGSGNYNDHLMEQLADAGNGNYAYIDTLNEANKVLVEEMGSTLQTIAKDVKIQIEFNPAEVSQYRLIGYENRMLKREDFNNDKIDAGEIGAGHTVTAIYEVIFEDSDQAWIEPLKYQVTNAGAVSGELAELRIRYKQPGGNTSKLIKWSLQKSDSVANILRASNDFQFAAAVAGFAQKLRGGVMINDFSYEDILTLARRSRGDDNFGYRGEFLKLVSLANSIDTPVATKQK